jgi:hypothetical protein
MRTLVIPYRMWIRGPVLKKSFRSIRSSFSLFPAVLIIFFGITVQVHAQVEDDTTRVERDLEERPETERYNDFIMTPYHIDIPGSQIERYRLYDFQSRHRFYRRLQYYGIADFLLDEDEEFNMYGPEWEREINQRLSMILSETFKEQNSVLQLLSRIAPFLGFGFFEQYEVPIVPRIEDGDRVYTED